MRRANGLLFKVLRIAVLVYVGLCGIMFFAQRSLIYYPQPRLNRDGVALMRLEIEAGAVLVSTRPVKGADAVIYFGGNAEDTSLALRDFEDAFPQASIYLMHYRGYGGSAGKASEDALFADGLKLFDRVHAEHANVTVVGRSLGSGVAVKVASERPAARLVLVTPFGSLADVAAAQYPFLPVRLLMRDRYDSWKYAGKVTSPVRMIVAERDEIIPRASTERLRTRFGKTNVSYVVIPGAGHNSISDDAQYWRAVADGGK
jgi:uncharacterized protein